MISPGESKERGEKAEGEGGPLSITPAPVRGSAVLGVACCSKCQEVWVAPHPQVPSS